MIVSPASGNRGVTDTMSALREPMTRISGAMLKGRSSTSGDMLVVARSRLSPGGEVGGEEFLERGTVLENYRQSFLVPCINVLRREAEWM